MRTLSVRVMLPSCVPASARFDRRAEVAEMSASDFKAGVEERAGEGGAPGHVELPVDLARVVVDSGRAEEKLGGDVPVGGTDGGQPGDLSLLRGELRAVSVGAFHGVLASGGQLGAGSKLSRAARSCSRASRR